MAASTVAPLDRTAKGIDGVGFMLSNAFKSLADRQRITGRFDGTKQAMRQGTKIERIISRQTYRPQRKQGCFNLLDQGPSNASKHVLSGDIRRFLRMGLLAPKELGEPIQNASRWPVRRCGTFSGRSSRFLRPSTREARRSDPTSAIFPQVQSAGHAEAIETHRQRPSVRSVSVHRQAIPRFARAYFGFRRF